MVFTWNIDVLLFVNFDTIDIYKSHSNAIN